MEDSAVEECITQALRHMVARIRCMSDRDCEEQLPEIAEELLAIARAIVTQVGHA